MQHTRKRVCVEHVLRSICPEEYLCFDATSTIRQPFTTSQRLGPSLWGAGPGWR
jgi:hypothetical protein